ncbi:glycosyltransferase family 9 protein, partial [Oharaeibacter diazotrophicus]
AAAAYERALAVDPEHAVARHNLGNLLPDLGRPHEGAAHLRRVAAARPDLAEARYNLAIALLRLGDYATGFRLYESRWDAPGFTGRRFYRRLPTWTGAPFQGRRLVVHAEQGLGDTLQFVRFAPLVRSLGGTLTLQVQSGLVRLLDGLKGADAVVGEGAEVPGQDLVAPMMSLPHLLGLTLGSIPARVPYLFADLERVARWRDRLHPRAGERLVAVGFRGNPAGSIDRGRSLSDPALLAPLAAVPGVRLIAVNKLDPAETVEVGGVTRLAAEMALEHPGPGFDAGPDAFLDTAAMMALCDGVVTTDTSLAHLAGALGRPTILMVKTNPDWRWMLGRTDSPWYPTMRLVRQETAGDWAGVVDVVARLLAEGS